MRLNVAEKNRGPLTPNNTTDVAWDGWRGEDKVVPRGELEEYIYAKRWDDKTCDGYNIYY